MKKINAGWLAVAGAVAAIALILIVDRARGPEDALDMDPRTVAPETVELPTLPMVQERMEDPEYVASLHELVDERRTKILEAAAVRNRMAPIVEAAEDELRAEAEAAARANGEPVETLPPVSKEALKERVQRHPEWPALEAELVVVQRELNLIQRRSETTIRDRMNEQYAMRRAARAAHGGAAPAPMAAVPEIQLLEQHGPEIETYVLTNVPARVRDALPPVPERIPVGLDGRPLGDGDLNGETP